MVVVLDRCLPETCNIAAYLAEQERDCQRLAHVIGLHTPTGAEWARLARAAYVQRATHDERCEKCQNPTR